MRRNTNSVDWQTIYTINPSIEKAGVSLAAFLKNPTEVIENVLYSGVKSVRMDAHHFMPLLPQQRQIQSNILTNVGERGE